MKKALALVLAGMMALSLAACGGGSGSSSAAAPAETEAATETAAPAECPGSCIHDVDSLCWFFLGPPISRGFPTTTLILISPSSSPAGPFSFF